MVEYRSIAAGIDGADQMVKAAEVTPLFFRTLCPGKFLAAISGRVGAVGAAIQAGRARHPEMVVDGFVLANIHPDVVRALMGACLPAGRNALGILETFTAASIVLAADAAVKAASVQLLDVRIAVGLGGKGYALLTGDLAACETAVAAGAAVAGEQGLLLNRVVIAHPDDSLLTQIL
jgi:microcompartment protein CcmL/EutN